MTTFKPRRFVKRGATTIVVGRITLPPRIVRILTIVRTGLRRFPLGIKNHPDTGRSGRSIPDSIQPTPPPRPKATGPASLPGELHACALLAFGVGPSETHPLERKQFA